VTIPLFRRARRIPFRVGLQETEKAAGPRCCKLQFLGAVRPGSYGVELNELVVATQNDREKRTLSVSEVPTSEWGSGEQTPTGRRGWPLHGRSVVPHNNKSSKKNLKRIHRLVSAVVGRRP
jgi:hypothetical protein